MRPGDERAPPMSGVRSMTGHGVGEAPAGGGRVVIEARAVNHRYLDVRVRLAGGLAAYAPAVERVVRGRLERGRVDVTGAAVGGAGATPVLDLDRARAAFGQLLALRDELAPEQPVPLSLLVAVPDLFTEPDAAGARDEGLRAALEAATATACDALTRMRRREGANLARALEAELSSLRELVGAVSARCPERVESHRAKLSARIATLLEGSGVEVDAARIAHEVALFADRGDVEEELVRLRSHADEALRLLRAPAGPVGKRLDFLLQEMARETNTVGAKCADAEIAHRVVEMKTHLSRMREQAQNLI